MALHLGTENKRQVLMLGGLLVVIVILGITRLPSLFGGSPAPTPKPVAAPAVRPATASGSQTASGPQALKLTDAGLNPALHLEKLALTEQLFYHGLGRNLFSSEASAAPVKIEAPLKSARPEAAQSIQPMAAEPPKPPAIPLKYFGYTQNKDKSMRAFFVRGDEIFVAHVGDIVDHRFKIVAIQPGSAQVTDLGYNNTQILPLQSQ